MIISGYSAIGKSTVVDNMSKNCIDLDSSLFRVNGSKAKNWYKIYVSIANELSKQGYNVFVSAHPEVIQELKKVTKDFLVIYPDLQLKQVWLDRLHTRYLKTLSLKDLCALNSANENYEKEIEFLENEKDLNKIKLTSYNYDLYKLIMDRLK